MEFLWVILIGLAAVRPDLQGGNYGIGGDILLGVAGVLAGDSSFVSSACPPEAG